jgi:hypothetical protein
VLEDYIINHKFTPDQLLQIIAVLQKKVSKENES